MGSQVADPEGTAARRVGRRRDWAWMVVGVGLALLKTEVLSGLLHHEIWVIVMLALGLVFSVLRTLPIGVALTAGPLLAFALGPSSTALGIAVGVGAFVLLVGLFFAVGTVLRARQDHSRSRASKPRVQPTTTVMPS
jgi:hypothetical protein